MEMTTLPDAGVVNEVVTSWRGGNTRPHPEQWPQRGNYMMVCYSSVSRNTNAEMDAKASGVQKLPMNQAKD